MNFLLEVILTIKDEEGLGKRKKREEKNFC
jgi:hypothetical protein